MTDDDLALVHMRVPRAMKARWVALSRQRGQKLTEWIVGRVDPAPPGRLTPVQFDALAALGLTPGADVDAARRVLVEGLTVAEAAQSVGVGQPEVNATLGRCEAILTLAIAATH
jgi:hypothetical protein